MSVFEIISRLFSLTLRRTQLNDFTSIAFRRIFGSRQIVSPLVQHTASRQRLALQYDQPGNAAQPRQEMARPIPCRPSRHRHSHPHAVSTVASGATRMRRPQDLQDRLTFNLNVNGPVAITQCAICNVSGPPRSDAFRSSGSAKSIQTRYAGADHKRIVEKPRQPRKDCRGRLSFCFHR
jgi:hypothetical protein